MSQIKKKFIQNNAIDGTKVLFLNNESFRVKDSSGNDVDLFKLTAGNVFQMMAMPQTSSDPTNNNDLARKSYIDAADSAVQSAAEAYTDQKIADLVDGAPSLLNTLNELAAAINDDANFATTVLNAISDEASARQSADETLQDNIDAEQSARESADSALDGRLDVLEGGDSTVGSVAKALKDAKDYTDQEVSAEESARVSADNALDARLDILEGADSVSGSVAKALKDAKDYADAIDADLQGQIDTEKNRIDAILLASDADKDSFAEIVSLINSVDTTNDNAFASYVLSNDAALAQEVSDRQSGDSSLQTELDATQTGAGLGSSGGYTAHSGSNYLKSSDFSSASLTGNLHNADKLLDIAVKAEVDARIAAISAEQSARETADEELSDRIYALETFEPSSPAKAKFTLTALNISNGYIDLPDVVVGDSEHVFVGSLYVHPSDSYTTSTVNGVTRITWAGEVASGGISELVEGDVVYVRYWA